MQSNAAGKGHLCSIFNVPPNRKTPAGKLNPNLMLASRQQLNLNQRTPIDLPQFPVAEFGLFPLIGLRPKDLAVPLVFAESIHTFGFGRSDGSFDKSGVNFFDGVFPKLLVEPRRRFGSPGKENNTGDRHVEPADHSKIHFARLGILLFKIRLGLCEQSLLSIGQSHRGKSRRLDQRNNVIVLVEYVHRNIYYILIECLICTGIYEKVFELAVSLALESELRPLIRFDVDVCRDHRELLYPTPCQKPLEILWTNPYPLTKQSFSGIIQT